MGAAQRPGHGLRPGGIPVTRSGAVGGDSAWPGIAVSQRLAELPAGSAAASTPSPVVSGQAGVALVPLPSRGLVITALGPAWFLSPKSLPPRVVRGHPQGPSSRKALCWAHGQHGRAEGETHSGSAHPTPPGTGGQLLGRARAVLLPPSAGAPALQAATRNCGSASGRPHPRARGWASLVTDHTPTCHHHSRV